jgi:hypothetical protein
MAGLDPAISTQWALAASATAWMRGSSLIEPGHDDFWFSREALHFRGNDI